MCRRFYQSGEYGSVVELMLLVYPTCRNHPHSKRKQNGIQQKYKTEMLEKVFVQQIFNVSVCFYYFGQLKKRTKRNFTYKNKGRAIVCLCFWLYQYGSYIARISFA